MRKAAFALLAILAGLSVSAQADRYRSHLPTGFWDELASWQQFDPNSSNWIPATQLPDVASGEIEIQGGTQMLVRDARISDQLTVKGELTVQTGGSLTINDGAGNDLVLSGGLLAGNGELILNGDFYWTAGTVSRNVEILPGKNLFLQTNGAKTNQGTLTIQSGATAYWDEGTLSNSQTIQNNGMFIAFQNAGTLHLEGAGSFVNTGTFHKQGNGTVQINSPFNNTLTGLIQGEGTISQQHTNFSNSGTITPGTTTTTGILTYISNNLFNTESRLLINIVDHEGLPGVSNDQLIRIGNLALNDATLVIDAIPGLLMDETFHLITTSTGLTGSFEDIIFPSSYIFSIAPDPAGLALDVFVFDVIPLPLRLVSFTGQPAGNSVQLNWKTSWESNTSHFEIERAARNSGPYQQIGTIQAAGQSTTDRIYSFTDQQAQAGMNYYRLKMVDTDGRTEYSDYVGVRMNGMQPGLGLFPNPVRAGAVQVQLAAVVQEKVQLQVHDLSGRLLRSETHFVNGNSVVIPLSLSSLSKGMYLVTVVTGSFRKTKTVVKD